MSAGCFALVALLASAPATTPPANAASTMQAPPVAVTLAGPGETQELTLLDGSRLYGRVIAIEPDRITFQTITGAEVTFAPSDLAGLRVVRGRVVNHEFRPTDSNTTRLFFGPTARSLPKGHGYFAVYETAIPFLQVGVTDRISVGVGTPLVFGSGSSHPFWVSPKVQVLDRATTTVAVGLLHVSTGDADQVGIAYGVTTLGDDDSAATIGVGYAYETTDGAGAAIVMVGGERRVSRRLKFITENYWWAGGPVVVSGGVRFIGDRLSADVGLVAPLTDEQIVVPVVNFVWAF